MKILYLKDGTSVPILTDHTFADLIEETLGRDAREYLNDLIEETLGRDAREYLNDLIEYYELEIESLRDKVEELEQ